MGFSMADTGALIAHSRRYAAGIGIIFLMLGIFAVVVLRKFINSPLDKIKSTIESFAAGDLSGRIQVKNEDIIGGLAEAINVMADKWTSMQSEWGILNKGLEQRVAERTRDLEEEVNERRRAEEELRFYMAKLERSNRELEDFAFVASQDLQEPLRKIQTFSDRLKAACGEEISVETVDYLGGIQSAAGKMQTLIKDLLIFSMVTSKARPFGAVDMNRTIAEAVSDLEETIEKLGADVQIGTLPEIEADTLQIRQLFQNLIANALKFHKDGVPPAVRVAGEIINGRRSGDISEQQFCHITIEDNGIGFDNKYSDKIFTVFQRLHDRTEYEGTGLGLAVCRKIVERHNGTIIADSNPGQGARFQITLPICQNQEQLSQQMVETDSIKIDEAVISDGKERQVIEKGPETSFMVPCP